LAVSVIIASWPEAGKRRPIVAREPEREMAKKYPVLYTILVWIGIAAFGFMMFCGMYILSFLPEIPASDGEVRQLFIETGAAIVALGATNLIYLGMSLWRNRAA
jgi:cytochrome b561